MEYSEIKQVIKDMEESKLSELTIEFKDGTKLSMKKGLEEKPQATYIQSSVEEVKMEKIASIEVNQKEDNSKIVTSPMVGTFYAKSSPNANPFVEVRKYCKKRRYSLHNCGYEAYE